MDVIPDRTTRVRRTCQAACLAVAGVLIALSFALTIPADSPAEEVAAIADQHTRFLTGNALLVTGGLLLVPGSVGIAQLLRRRGSGLLTTGAVTTGLGGAALALAVWGYTVAGRVITDDPVPREAAVQVLDRAYDDPVIGAIWVLGMGALVGPLLVGAALLRVPVVPRWVGALLVVAPVPAFLGSDGPLGALLAVPFAAALAALAWQLLQAREEGAEPAGPREGHVRRPGPAPRTPDASESVPGGSAPASPGRGVTGRE